MAQLAVQGVPWSHAARHMLGLRHGQPGARRWRQVWSDHRLKNQTPGHVHRLAMAALTAERAPVLP
jgi:tRNA-dihydrouridine synthase A